MPANQSEQVKNRTDIPVDEIKGMPEPEFKTDKHKQRSLQ